MKPKHDPLCLYQVSTCDCGAREKLMPEYIKRQKKILKRMEDKLLPSEPNDGWKDHRWNLGLINSNK